MATYRDRDMKIERVIAQYLDSHLYNQDIFSKAERTDSIDDQLSGSDIILSIPSVGVSDIIVDEKAATHYINKDIPTFALELSFRTATNNRVEGWLTDESKKTEYYLLMWVWANKKNAWEIELADITKIEYMLISRQKILDYLTTQGLGRKELQDKAASILASTQSGPIEKSYGCKYYFYYTRDGLGEQPVNLIMYKDKLKECSILSGTI